MFSDRVSWNHDSRASIYFGDCFGWFHPASGDVAVLICAPVGFEKQCMHRPIRALAEMLAASGYPALRFDLPGTGDSRLCATEPDLVRRWLSSTVEAASWLRKATGAREIVFVGLHLGALLATYAAAQTSPGRLALLLPVCSGRRYVRSLQVLAQLGDGSADDRLLEAAGLSLHSSAMRELRELSLRNIATSPASRVLMMGRLHDAEENAVETRLRSLGCDITRETFAGADLVLRDAHLNVVPDVDFRRLVDWLNETGGSARFGTGPGHDAGPRETALHLPDATEYPVEFETGGHRLFGIYCAPTRSAAGPAVIFCNTGGNPHYGYGRSAVYLARHLARFGHASFRIDLGGIGDSVGARTDCQPRLYADDHRDELRAAIDTLAARGHHQVVLFGVCSGAFQSVHMALSDHRVVGLVLVNQLKWIWAENPLAKGVRKAARAWRALNAARRVEKRAVMMVQPPVGSRAPRRLKWHLLGLAARMRIGLEFIGLQSFSRLPLRAVKRLSRRGVRTMVVVGRNDDAYDVMEVYFGQDGGRLARVSGASAEIVDHLEHSLGTAESRAVMGRLLVSHIDAIARDRAGAMPCSAIDNVIAFPAAAA